MSKDEWVYLRDLSGRCAGMIRPYAPTAADIAIASGFAEVPTTELPEEFPGRKELVAAGFEAVEDVPDTLEALTALPGIGKKTAKGVLEAVADLSE